MHFKNKKISDERTTTDHTDQNTPQPPNPPPPCWAAIAKITAADWNKPQRRTTFYIQLSVQSFSQGKCKTRILIKIKQETVFPLFCQGLNSLGSTHTLLIQIYSPSPTNDTFCKLTQHVFVLVVVLDSGSELLPNWFWRVIYGFCAWQLCEWLKRFLFPALQW